MLQVDKIIVSAPRWAKTYHHPQKHSYTGMSGWVRDRNDRDRKLVEFHLFSGLTDDRDYDNPAGMGNSGHPIILSD